MSTVIRFARHGKKKSPFFRIVVQDSRCPRDGRHIENLGYFNPVGEKETLVVKRDRLEYWLGTGAQVSESLRRRLQRKMKQWEGPAADAPQPPTSKKDAKPNQPVE